VDGPEELALHDLSLVGVVRIVTNPRIVRPPAPVELALDFVHRLIAAPRARWLSAGPRAWSELATLAAGDRALGGNLTPDAYLASLALTHGCRWRPPTGASPGFRDSTGLIQPGDDAGGHLTVILAV
jgi:predicted nucleic acid-binding protein